MTNPSVGVKASTAGARAALRKLFAQIDSGAQRALENAAAAAEKAARATTTFKDGPRRPGKDNLRDSLRHGSQTPYQAYVVAMSSHGVIVEEGSVAHWIKARRKPYLVFFANGHWNKRKAVWHPGTKPTHFMRDASLAVAPILRRNIEALTNTAIRRHNQ